METPLASTATDRQKSIVNQLNFGAKTAKRATWEAWAFRIVGEGRVEVTNESYGHEKDEHRYVVTVDERDGLFVPVECECPADEFNDEYACKHRVAVATVGGPVVLGAAMAYRPDEPAPHLRADGGIAEAEAEERPDDCDCAPFMGDLPCWPCYRAGFEAPNPDAEEDDQ